MFEFGIIRLSSLGWPPSRKRRRQMLDDTLKNLEADKRWQDNALVAHLRPFATSLIEKGHRIAQ